LIARKRFQFIEALENTRDGWSRIFIHPRFFARMILAFALPLARGHARAEQDAKQGENRKANESVHSQWESCRDVLAIACAARSVTFPLEQAAARRKSSRPPVSTRLGRDGHAGIF
jgi:ribosomal protein L9